MKTVPSHNHHLRLAIIPLIAAGFLVLATLACATIIPPSRSTVTATPTGQIGAVEAGTPTPGGDKKDWQVWSGTITSKTSRQFKSNGSIVNTCETDWSIDMMFTIDPTGNVDGVGTASLSAGPNCSPHAISGNTTGMTISVKGRKDQSAIYLNLGTTDFEPNPSGDFGGYTLLVTNGACPPVMATLTIPLTGPTTAQAQLNLTGVMTGCAGSKDDVMTNQSQVELKYNFKCSDNPNNSDTSSPATKICQ